MWLSPSHCPGLCWNIPSSEIASPATFYNAAHPICHTTPCISFTAFVLWNYLFICPFVTCVSPHTSSFLFPVPLVWYWGGEDERGKQHVLSPWEFPVQSSRSPGHRVFSVCSHCGVSPRPMAPCPGSWESYTGTLGAHSLSWKTGSSLPSSLPQAFTSAATPQPCCFIDTCAESKGARDPLFQPLTLLPHKASAPPSLILPLSRDPVCLSLLLTHTHTHTHTHTWDFLEIWPWASYLISLNLSFHIYKKMFSLQKLSRGLNKITHKVPRTVPGIINDNHSPLCSLLL